MTISQRTSAKGRRQGVDGGAPERNDDAESIRDGALRELTTRIAELESTLERVRSAQEAQFVQVMKFTVLRHISVLGLLMEQGAAPLRIKEQARRMIDEEVRKIAQAQDLDEVRELDMALQKQVRGVIGAFSSA
ncbi:MAG: hypothetical protein J4N83_00830 [Chloroflexi bacterium]|nr:hypothetical protein [Chloroflexota bacterium]MCI0768799.1 hypothetical protein [Chloroflexota bacterium]